MAEYVIKEVAPDDDDVEGVYEPYGVVKEFFYDTSQEVMLSGPYDTGKTYGALQKLLTLMWLYKNLHILLVRKTYSSLKNSAIQSLFDKVLPDHPDNLSEYNLYGGGTPQSLTVVPTGSTMKFGGMDEPRRVLSAEYDFIFVPQAEELSIGDWEQLMGRANGRAGHSPFPQIMGDCNPDVPEHWIVNRPSLNVFHTTHLDNPTIYARDRHGSLVLDVNGEPLPTPGGVLRLNTLRAMTGLRYQRGFLGKWVGAEGVVYGNFDKNIHVVDKMPVPKEWKKYRSIDFGFNHPFVCQWWAMDDMKKLHLYREIHMTKRTVNQHVLGDDFCRGIIELTGDEWITATICDHDAEDRATLAEHGIRNIVNADKRVSVGIEKVQDRLALDGAGLPGIYFHRGSLVEADQSLKDAYKPTWTVEEFPGYVWPDITNKPVATSKDENPLKKNDDSMDATRYMVMYFDGRGTGKTRAHRYA